MTTLKNYISKPNINRQTLMQDLLAGVTGAVAGAPQAMGFALIAGVNPIYGVYGAFIATIVGTFTASSTFMTIAPTNALALVVMSTLGSTGEVSIEKMIVLTVLVGVFQLVFGLLRLGDLTRFVSNGVMTGFITGAGLLIVLGQLAHVNGFEAHSPIWWSDSFSTTLPKFFNWLFHLPQSHPHTLVIGVVSIVIIHSLHHTRFKSVATLTAIVVTSIFVTVAGWTDVATVAQVPPGLPLPKMPNLQYIPDLLSPALAMAVLALVQGAALTRTIREPDGSMSDTNRDFIGQGLANIAGGLFQGLPSGGSLSRTAVNIAAGAQTRLANFLAGVFVGLILLVFGSLIERITLAALAGHLVVAAISLIKPKEIALVWRVNPAGRAAMVATFIATLVLPLEFSIYIGVVLSLAIYIYTSSENIKVVRLIRTENNHFREVEMPKTLPKDEVLIASVHGHLYFAAVRQLEEHLPDPSTGKHTVLVLRLRNNRYLGSTGIHFLERYAEKMRANNGRLILTGITPAIRDQLQRTHFLEFFGEDNIFLQSETIFDATEHAIESAEKWLKESIV